MSICVFDIYSDGSARIPKDSALTGPGNYRWWHYDLNDPELADWAKTHLAEIPTAALVQPETRPRCDRYDSGLILNLRGINMNQGQQADQMVSIRMWVASDVIVTVRVRKVFAIDDIRQLTLAGKAPPTPAAFVEGLVARLTKRVQDEVLQISERTAFFETDLDDDTTPPPKELPQMRRRVIRLLRYLEPQRAAVSKLAASDLPLMPEDVALWLREQANRTTLAVEELDALRDRLNFVQDDHDLSVARTQSRHGYILSLAAGIFLPLGFLTGLFGVNIAGMPGLAYPWAFAVLCAGMAGLVLAMVVALKLTRWW